MDYNAPLFQHPQEVWDAKKCEKAAKHVAKDGLGTKYPFKGYIGGGSLSPYGAVRYNGGCIRDGKWWQGENRPLPKVADGYEIISVPTWGYRIRKIEKLITDPEIPAHWEDDRQFERKAP